MKWFQRRHRRTLPLSIVVILYNMEREAPRTLHSLSAAYQRGGLGPDDYEVIVVDNGSPSPFGAERVRRLGTNFRYFYLNPADPSPAKAVNFGVSQGDSEYVGILIDGARLVTPNLLSVALLAFRLHPNPVVSATGWHLGPEPQNRSILNGYGPTVEDALLDSIGWPDQDPYRLFGIACLGGSAKYGCFCPISESNAIFLRRDFCQRLGGFDEAFRFPGGGLVNLDFFFRCLSDSSSILVNLLGEACFHQVHAGVSTNATPEDQIRRYDLWNEEYKALRGHDYAAPDVTATTLHFGPVSPHALPYLKFSAEQGMERYSALLSRRQATL